MGDAALVFRSKRGSTLANWTAPTEHRFARKTGKQRLAKKCIVGIIKKLLANRKLTVEHIRRIRTHFWLSYQGTCATTWSGTQLVSMTCFSLSSVARIEAREISTIGEGADWWDSIAKIGAYINTKERLVGGVAARYRILDATVPVCSCRLFLHLFTSFSFSRSRSVRPCAMAAQRLAYF